MLDLHIICHRGLSLGGESCCEVQAKSWPGPSGATAKKTTMVEAYVAVLQVMLVGDEHS